MNTLVTLLLATQAFVSLSLAIGMAFRESTYIRENAMMILHMLSVFVWNLCYAILMDSGNERENLRYVCRNVAVLMMIFSMLFSHYTAMSSTGVKKKTVSRIIKVEMIIGLIIYPMNIARESVRFTKVSYGWTYYFEPYIGRTIFDIFLVIIFVSTSVTAIYGMFHAKKKREKVFSKYVFICSLIMMVSMLPDTILPLLNKPLFPGSAIGMFICTIMIYIMAVRKNVERLTVSNVSPYIFNTIDMPMLVIDEKNNISLMNKAANSFFHTTADKISGHNLEKFFEMEAALDDTKTLKELKCDAKCKVNFAECTLQFTPVSDLYGGSLGHIVMITDVTDKIQMINELEEYRNHLQENLNKKSLELQSVILEAITAIANTIDAKDEYTNGHSKRVAEYATALAVALHKDEEYVSNLRHMALLHDIGKIGVPDSVLNKVGRLTDTEFEMIKQHTSIGADILKNITMIQGVNLGAKYHHERYDGRGYPQGLAGEEIPYEARIIGIADAYDAMTSNRVYRKRLPKEVVMEELRKGRGVQFDPEMTDVFLTLVESGQVEPRETIECVDETVIEEGTRLLENTLSSPLDIGDGVQSYMSTHSEKLKFVRQYFEKTEQTYRLKSKMIVFHIHANNQEYTSESMEHAKQSLDVAIHKSLKNGSFCNICRENQIIVVIMDENKDNIHLSMNRILQNYYRVRSENIFDVNFYVLW